ncbi:HAD family hydrolase [Flexithrix dorotheae]|uniref:HAD family hydrolase n=1 Tax=Flexithrix dorotheae TaxID=70993 RepID=UPI0003709C84|nr:HAD hydrolase-like protein [Flexithrix dorotheae]
MAEYILVFDKDGVIVDSEELKIQSIEKIFADVNPAEFELIKIYNRANRGLFRKSKIQYILSHILKENHIAEKVDKMLIQCRDMVYEVMGTAQMIPGVEAFIKNAPQKKYVSSAAPQEEVIDNLKQFGIYDQFEGIYGHPNSDKAAILRNLSQKNDLPVFFFGDTLLDMEEAEKAEVNFIGIETAPGTFNGLNVDKVKDFRAIDEIQKFIDNRLNM